MRSALLPVALCLLAATASAQIKSGSKWRSRTGNGTVTITNDINYIQNTARSRFTDNGGWDSGWRSSVPSGGTSVSLVPETTCTWTDPETGEENTGGTYKVDGGRVWEKDGNGTWWRLRPTKKTKEMDPEALPQGPSTEATGEGTVGTAPMQRHRGREQAPSRL